MRTIQVVVLSILIVVAFTGCVSNLPGNGQSKDIPRIDFFSLEGLEYSSERIVVKATDTRALEIMLVPLGAEMIKSWESIGWTLVRIPEGHSPESFMELIMKDSNVLLTQPDILLDVPKPSPTDTFDILSFNSAASEVGVAESVEIDKLWGLNSINAFEAWEDTVGSRKVLLAVIDTGVQRNHPEFSGKEFIGAFDATGEEDPFSDYNGHGTHVAGIFGADGRDGKIAGVAWDSPIMPVRVMDSDGLIYLSYLIDATLYVANFVEKNSGFRAVINMSIGGRGYYFVFKDAIDYSLEQGVVFVTSAGNAYKRVVSFPTAYNGAIAVAASTPTGDKADFSTTGPWTSVAAPGVAIVNNTMVPTTITR